MEKIENSVALFDGIKYEKINEALFNNDMTAFIYLFLFKLFLIIVYLMFIIYQCDFVGIHVVCMKMVPLFCQD